MTGSGSGIGGINGQTGPSIIINTGTTGLDFNIVSAANTITLELPTADSTHTGKLLNTDWVIFNNKQNALTFGSISSSSTDLVVTNGANSTVGPNVSLSLTSGNLTAAGTDGISITNGTGAVLGTGTSISQHVADSTHNGYLASADWSTFNGKQNALGFTPENVANKGIAGGYAGLDGSGKVPYAQLPSALMTFKGAWNASTNTPTLADGTGTAGDTYRASVAGTQNLGSGPQTWAVGDFVIYNGTIWQHSPAADGVSSVNGFTGAFTLTQGNLTELTSSILTITGGTNAVWGSGDRK